MKYKIHRSLAEQIREGCEGRLNIRLRAGWFSFGNVYPDVSHQRIMHMHEADSAGRMVDRMIRRLCRWGIEDGKMLSRWNSLRLGILSHYICDFMCYVHTPAFKGSLKEHRAYEEEQSRYLDTQCARAVCSFYQAGSGEELTALLDWVLRERDPASYSPEDDLEYAAAVATELTCAILRIRTARREAANWWNHLPFMRRRYLSRT